MACASLEPIAAEMALDKPQPLNLGAHRSVENQNSVERGLAERLQRGLPMGE
jgi:hypothetical protein